MSVWVMWTRSTRRILDGAAGSAHEIPARANVSNKTEENNTRGECIQVMGVSLVGDCTYSPCRRATRLVIA